MMDAFLEERQKYEQILRVIRHKMRENKPFEAYDILIQLIKEMERKNGGTQ